MPGATGSDLVRQGRVFPPAVANAAVPSPNRRQGLDCAHHDYLGADVRLVHLGDDAQYVFFLRFLLGMMEAGFYSGIILYRTQWYR